MLQQFLEWLNAIGLPGLFLVMFLEGTSLPFPGVIVVLTFGYILSPGFLGIAILAIGMSFSYSIASLIPYFFAMKLERFLPARIKKGLKEGQAFLSGMECGASPYPAHSVLVIIFRMWLE